MLRCSIAHLNRYRCCTLIERLWSRGRKETEFPVILPVRNWVEISRINKIPVQQSFSAQLNSYMSCAMNTGHDGSLTTLHANAPREAVERLVTMVRFAVELPPDAIEAQIGNALDLIVQTARRPGGARCISEIAEVSFDHGRRRCVVRTLYRWEVGQEAGFWLDYPQWVDRLAPMGLADRREVKAWMRSLDLRQSA
ncbi:hypothetical protein DMP10_09555 [Adlercreutzia equolifaciens subsp. celatus DSM 18785]|uniref:Bacterial type II secretion system protein E domain-containing protein n=2 Tax=Adlercreutzia equolifaciens TaxID=446660 RepID=A0A3N0AQA6_9ACTN|nr:hypothetical protein DX904_05735 [Adlercreutzia equolifaciens subsp. celatus]RNL37003.1 hypothetical protein DMP10_09555 [Adlercreutzia equolifaciens subsp. celatus DSM 18785]